MKTTRTLIPAIAALAIAGCGGGDDKETPAPSGPRFSDARTIDNPYLPITESKRCELRGTSDGERERVVRTVLDETRRFRVGGQDVDAAVIEDRAFIEGELVERTLDYFAQADDGTVYYLGEHVDNYKGRKVADHNGTWLYGEDTRTAGVAMPADPQVGDRYRFEDVPGITTESNTVTARLPKLRVGGRTYTDVLAIRERIQPENEIEDKFYARGAGVIREVPPDGRVELVGCR
jgi:hypothetical protein